MKSQRLRVSALEIFPRLRQCNCCRNKVGTNQDELGTIVEKIRDTGDITSKIAYDKMNRSYLKASRLRGARGEIYYQWIAKQLE